MAFTKKSAEEYAAIPAGSYFGYSKDGTTWTELPNIRGIGSIGSKASFVDCTPLSSTEMKSIAGIKEPPEVQFTFLDAPDETDWTDFLKLADDTETVHIKIWLPNGRLMTGSYTLSGAELSDPSRDAALEFQVSAKQNSKVWAVGENKPTPAPPPLPATKGDNQ